MKWLSPTRERMMLGLGLVASLALRLSLFPFVTGDMAGDMIPWSGIIEREGAWKALGEEFSNYPPLYLYLLTLATWLPLPRLWAIKSVYLVFDYALALYVGGIVGRVTGKPGFWSATLATLFLPTVLMNSSLWGQCDAMYASGLVACVYYLLVNRSLAAMVAYGLAFALKPQAVFLAPLILVLVWQRRFSPLLLYVPAAVYVLLALPVWLAGRSFLDVMLLYANQRILPFPALTLGATNLYQWVPGVPFEQFFKAGLGLSALSAVALMVTLARRFPAGMSPPGVLHAALLSLVLMPFVLPAMHERYFFAADTLAVAYAFACRRGWGVAGLIQTASAFTYLPYLFDWEPVPRPVLAVLMAGALGWLGWELAARVRPTTGGPALATTGGAP
jgi:Gpi18-like mannosyltransferase